MTFRRLAAAAAILFAVSAAQASEPGLASAVLACSAKPDAKTQLACYNDIAARLKAAPAASTAGPESAKPESVGTNEQPKTYGTPDDFGKNDIPFAKDRGPQPLNHITAGVADVRYNYFRRFTVTLDNGQVWRQDDSDTRIARIGKKAEKVTIHRGFLGVYILKIDGQYGTYRVHRIK